MWQQPALIGRAADLEYIRQCAAVGACCSIVGVSNLGKSALLRRLCAPALDAADLAFIREQADGHPGLVQTVCYALGAVSGAPVRDAQQDRVVHGVTTAGGAAVQQVDDERVKAGLENIWDGQPLTEAIKRPQTWACK